jgi:hypothetical protein
VVCAREHGRYQRYRPALAISPGDLAFVARDLGRRSESFETFPSDCGDYLDTLILAQNTWGDVVAVNPICDRYIGPAGNTGGSVVWRQSLRGQQVLDRLVADALAT